jgi:predicted ATPase
MKRRIQPRHDHDSVAGDRPSARLESGVRERVVATNLVLPAARFVGRRREMASVRALLARTRFLTIVGAAGSGKSRLACASAVEAFGDFADAGGAWIVDLADVTSADALCAAVARVLAVDLARSGADAVARLGAAIAARGPMLIVLDGADRLAAPCARTLSLWERATPDARWLATARGRLGVEGETALKLGPLSLPAPGGQPDAADAVQLYLERARATRFEGALGDGGAAEVAELVRTLEGNALAIELVAASARTTPPARWLRYLSRPAARETPALNVIEASMDALEAWERDALAQCSVFAGGFDVDAAESVVDLTEHAGAPGMRAVLASLCESSLLENRRGLAGTVRYSMGALVREQARDRSIAQCARDAVVTRHARYFIALANECAAVAEGPDRPRALVRLAAETDNVLAAHRHMLARAPTRDRAELALEAALAMDPLLAATGPHSLRLALLDGALSAARRARADAALQGRALRAYTSAMRALALRDEVPLVLVATAAWEPDRRADGAPHDALVVCARGQWFRAPGGPEVPIARWRALQLLVQTLAERRERAPGEPLAVEALIAAGWPGERMLAKAGATRVYTAMSTLRRLGLRDMLVHVEGGYLFEPSVPIRRVGDP